MSLSCPTCGKVSAEKFRPFCSARCADIDLGRWLGGRYRVETEEKPGNAETPQTSADDEDPG
jgi:endogenous inhibitor of DNA gyrase (YacG/DUF329 family)